MRSLIDKILSFCDIRGILMTLIGLNALYMSLVAFGNITDFGVNQQFVKHVLSMDTTNFGAPAGKNLDPNEMWRAITNPLLQDLAYIGLIAWECLTAIVLWVSVIKFFNPKTIEKAKRWGTLGLLMFLALFIGGFITIGGEWFAMWKSTAWNGEEAALRNSIIAAIPLIILCLPTGMNRKEK